MLKAPLSPLRGVRAPYGTRFAAAIESVIAGIFTAARARLDDNTHVSAVTNGPTWQPSQYRIAAPGVAATISFTIPAMSGAVWVYSELAKDDEETGLGWRFRGLVPTYDVIAARPRGGQQVFKLPANTGSVTLQALFGTGLVGTLKNAQPVQMDTILAQPFDVYVCMGQSQMAATSNALGIVPELDYCFDPTLLYFPGSTYTGHGSVIGQVDALRAPLQATGDVGGAVGTGIRSNGVSPAIAFAKAIRAATAAGRNVVIVQAAVSSTNLVGAGGAWNPAGTLPFAYNHAVGLIAGAMAAAPVGSKIKGVLWCQGESDLSNLAGYAAAWAAMRAAFELTWTTNLWTDAPVNWIIGTTPPDAIAPQTAAFIDTQNKMDQNSGDATSQVRCRVVNRLPGVEADGVHATSASNRYLGARMAERFLAGS